ncbi:MAG: TIGR02757 family protein [Tannerellaceae bacterium]
MDKQTEKLLRQWAVTYNTPDFIPNDPVQFPHRFTGKQDIEVSAFLTAWISYGRRSHILSKAEELHGWMGESPYRWIVSGEAVRFLSARKAETTGRDTFYRFYTYADLQILCRRMEAIYSVNESMENALPADPHLDPVTRLQLLFSDIPGIPVLHGSSACKRLAMFLRWMVRTDGIVDFGIWQSAIRPHELLIPLDTHVHQISLALGLTMQKSATLRTAREITDALSRIFPGDPCLGDFALFGYDINNSSFGSNLPEMTLK